MDVPNTSWPGVGLADYLVRAWRHWYPKRMFSPRLTAELLAPICLIVQACYLLLRRDVQSPYWRMGIGFVFSYLLLSPDVFVEQISFTRDVIPLAVAFNIAMRKEKGWRFAAWFVAGNVGLCWGLRETMLALF
jgi:hypothetical protein